jgi:NitT/TauT family transport system permease protein
MRLSRSGRRTGRVPAYLRLDQVRTLGLPPWAWAAVAVGVCLVAVEVWARYVLANPYELVPVTTMASRALELAVDPEFLRRDLAWSSMAIGASFASAGVVGVCTAYVMHRFGWWDRALQPYVSVFYAVPVFAMYPLLIVLFGTGLAPVVTISAVFSMIVVIANARVGFSSVPATVDKLSSSLRLSRTQHLRKVLLPAALPDIISGLKLAFSYAIVAVLATEFILSTRGVGHFISQAYATFNSADMYGGIFLVSLLALGLVLAANRLGAALDWRQR